MAESVARVRIQATADLKGFDDASKALRDLQRAVGPADSEIAKVRQEILSFAEANKRSEAVINAQINALKQLKSQAALGGDVYKSLNRDIEQLKRSVGDIGGVFQGTARSMGDIGKVAQSTQGYINNQSKSFEAMRKQASETITTLQNLGRQADQLKNKGGQINFFSSGGRQAGGMFEVGRKGFADIQAFAGLVKRLQDQAQTATGKVARISEGLFALGASGAAVSKATAALGGVAGAADAAARYGANLSGAFADAGAKMPGFANGLKGVMTQLSLLVNQPATGFAGWAQSLTELQNRINLLNAPAEAFNTTLSALGPEGAAAAGVMAVAFAGLQDAITRAFKAGEKDATAALQSITNETQELLRKLAELSEAFRGAASMRELQALRSGAQGRFNETPAGTDASRRAANTIASAEARIRIESQTQADVLEAARQRYRGSAQDVTSLSERLGYLNQAMKLVDQSTEQGSIEYARFSREAVDLKQQIDKLANSYRTVGEVAAQAARKQSDFVNPAIGNYFNRAAQRRQEEIAAAAREALSRPTQLLLPGAGQTSFTGEYGAGGMGGGARRAVGNFEVAGTPQAIGAPMGSRTQAAELDAVARAANSAETELMQLYRAMQRMAQSQIDKKTQQAAFSYKDLANEIERTGRASDGSLNSLRQQRQLWDQLYNAVERTDPAFKKAQQNLARLDREIENRQPGGMRGKVGYIGQGVGAIASAGIFGGPEGAIGGALGGGIGAMLGGPAGFAAGSFIGSSIGAYAGMMRQNIAATGEFSAEVKRLEIALRGVTGSAQEFARAQEVIKLAGVELNVPVLEATKGFTQLTAAVKGAGGNVTDAEIVFRGVTEAIKATGGGAEEVQASLTAMSQIFSKGKVSAEELQGQLGERLPGAVTLFAEATGRTLPQLQKDLQDGTVGLADVMKFAASLSDKYGEQAAKMAASTEDSTSRMKVALDDLRLAFGSIVKPITASIQSVITKLAEMTTRALKSVGLVKDSMSELGAVGRGRDLQTRAADAYRLLGGGPQSESEKRAAFKAANELAKAATPQKSLVGVQQNLRTLQQARDIVRQITAEGLSDVQLRLLQDYGTKLDKRISSEQELLQTLKKQREVTDFAAAKTKDDKTADAAAKEGQKLARDEQLLQEAAARARIALDDAVFQNQIDLIKRRYDYEQELIRQQRDIWAGTFEGIRGDSARSFVDLQNRLADLRQRTFESNLGVASAQQELRSATRMEAVTSGGATSGIVARTGNTGQSTGAHLDLRWGDGRPITKADADRYFLVNGKAPSSFGVTSGYGPRSLFGRSFHSGIDFGTPAGSAITLKNGASLSRNLGNTGAGGYAIEVMTPEGTMRALHLMAKSAIGAPGGAAQVRRDVRAEGGLGVAGAGLAQARQIAAMDKGQVQKLEQLVPQDYAQKQTQSLRDQAKAMEDGNQILLKRMQLEAQGMRPELIDAQIKIAEIELQRSDKLAQLNENLRIAQELQDPTLIAAARAEIELANEAYARQITAVNALAQAQTAAGVALSGRIGQLRTELQELTNFENVIISVSNLMETEISGAISTAVSGLATGSQSIQQTLSQMFSNIGQAFVKMAADIIAKQLVMITLQTILKALGLAMPGGGGNPTAPGGDWMGAVDRLGSFTPGYAKGGVFGNGVTPFAKGGIVSRPTLFKFANGGTMQNGVMGEAGPEAIVPLKRGFDGRLGVAQVPEPRGGSNRMRDLMGSSPAQGASSPVLNMSFETTSIGGVEYVSREQLEAAMAETRRAASRDGAKRGMTMTLDKLQQSPSTRSRVGLR